MRGIIEIKIIDCLYTKNLRSSLIPDLMSITDFHCLLAGVNFEVALFLQEVCTTLLSHLGTGMLIIVASQSMKHKWKIIKEINVL